MARKPYYDIGAYVAEILSQSLAEAGTGTPQFALRVKILGTPTSDGGYVEVTQKYDRSVYMPLTEKTMSWVAPNLVKLGFKGEKVSELDPDSPNHQSFVGDQVDLWCSHRDDGKGGWQESWGISNQGQQREKVALDIKKTRQLDSLFGKALRANAPPPQVQTKASPVVNQHSQEITDDDIPF